MDLIALRRRARPRSTEQRVRSRLARHIIGVLTLTTLLAGCGQAPRVQTPHVQAQPTPTATPAPLPPAPLQWRQGTLPPNISLGSQAVAPSDGATGYLCDAAAVDTPDSPIVAPIVWLTHDFTAHWTQVGSIAADHINNGCAIEVDPSDPATAIATLTWIPRGAGAGPDIRETTTFATFDSGATWRKLNNPQPFTIEQFVTWNGTIFARRSVDVGNIIHTGIWASDDHMATWRLLDPRANATDAEIFWLAPATGEILAEYSADSEPGYLWDTLDSGSHWRQIAAPPSTTATTNLLHMVAWMPGPRQPWTICTSIVGVVTGGDQPRETLTCSVDSGTTWTQRPAINPGPIADSAPAQYAAVYAIASDGSILASQFGAHSNMLYRLAPNARQWQSQGNSPTAGTNIRYIPTPGAGVFWALGSTPTFALNT